MNFSFAHFGFALAAALVLGTTAPARADDAFECSIKQSPSNGVWLPEVVIVAHKDGDATATVNDTLIQHFEGKPIAAKVEVDNAKRKTFTWKLNVKSSSGQNAKFSFRLTVMKADLSASMAASPGRFSNNFTSTGICKRVKR